MWPSNLVRFAVGAALFLSAAGCTPQQPKCIEPISPKFVDGSTATEAEMHTAHDAVVRYQQESYAYQSCLVDAINAYVRSPPLLGRLYDDGYLKSVHEREDGNQREKVKVVKAFNAAAVAYNKLHP